MDRLEFLRWCAAATADIRYRPDRERVGDELYAHLEDRCAAMTEAGVPESEAVKRTLAAMGSAVEVGEQLAKIHRPFWGYALRCARWLLLVAAVLALFAVPRWIANLGISREPSGFPEIYFEADEQARGGIRSDRVFYAEPMCRDFSDGYRFTVTKASEWRTQGVLEDGSEVDSYDFFLVVEVFSLRSWAQDSLIMREFYAVDSLGSRYEAHMRSHYGKDPTLAGNPHRSGLFTVTWEMWLSEYRSDGADWIELRYDQSGRDVRLRINLTGGEAA